MTILFIILGYLAGSVSSAVLICNVMGLPDPREGGSGNPGATNVLRTAGKQAALLVLASDILKGFVPVIIANFFNVTEHGLGIVGLAAFIGHLYPCFFNFKGGKGVATGFGAIFALSPFVGLLSAVIWALTLAATRYVSLASMISFTATSVLAFIFSPSYILALLIMNAIVLWRHSENIHRLHLGIENKFTL